MREPWSVGASNKIPTFFLFRSTAIGEFGGQQMAAVAEIHIGKLVKDELRRQGRTARWLAAQVPTNRTNIYDIMRRKNIDPAMLMRLSEILEYNFFAVLAEEAQRRIDANRF